jgi:hypothetical protein
VDETTVKTETNWFDEFLGSVSAGIRVYQEDRAERQAIAMGLASPTQGGFPWLAIGLALAVAYVVWE